MSIYWTWKRISCSLPLIDGNNDFNAGDNVYVGPSYRNAETGYDLVCDIPVPAGTGNAGFTFFGYGIRKFGDLYYPSLDLVYILEDNQFPVLTLPSQAYDVDGWSVTGILNVQILSKTLPLTIYSSGDANWHAAGQGLIDADDDGGGGYYTY